MPWEKVLVPTAKLTDYLLSSDHPVGRSKAKLLRRLGYDEQSTALLERGLIEIARSGSVKEQIPTPYGLKYVIEGTLDTPRGDRVRMYTIWMEDPHGEVLSFVTAYPVK